MNEIVENKHVKHNAIKDEGSKFEGHHYIKVKVIHRSKVINMEKTLTQLELIFTESHLLL